MHYYQVVLSKILHKERLRSNIRVHNTLEDILSYNERIQPLKIKESEDRALQSQMAKVFDYSEWKLKA